MNSSQLEANWPRLLEHALAALDTLSGAAAWSWGGGTALSIRLDHRVSLDIDIFLTDTADLQRLSPNANPVVRAMTENWQTPGHYLKLLFDEGEVDFIVALPRTVPAYDAWQWRGRSLLLETTAEVLAKKLHWRGSLALARDIFDLEAARRFDGAGFEAALAAEPAGAARVADVMVRRERRIRKELPMAVRPTEKGAEILDLDILELAAVLRDGSEASLGGGVDGP